MTYTTLLNHLKKLLDLDGNVNTVTSDGYIETNTKWRKDIFPIVDVFVTGSPYLPTTAVTRYTVNIVAIDIRDNNKEQFKDKIWYNDNRHDNWNLTREILKTLQNRLLKDVLDTNITLESATDATRIDFGKTNGLDGWQQVFTIDVPDDYSTACSNFNIIDYSPKGDVSIPLKEFTFTFSDKIILNTGFITFYDSDGSLISKLEEALMSVNDNVLTLDTSAQTIEFAPPDDYYITVDAGLVSSNKGEIYKGISDRDILTFTIV